MRCLKCDSSIPQGFATCIKCGAAKPGAGPAAMPDEPEAAPTRTPAAKKKGSRRPPRGPSSVAVQKRLTRNIEGRAKPKSAIMVVSGVGALIALVGGGLLLYNYVSKEWEAERGEKTILEETVTLQSGQCACFEVRIPENTYVKVHFSSSGDHVGYLVNRAKFASTTISNDQVKQLNEQEAGARTSGGGMYIRGNSGSLFTVETHCSPGPYAVFAANWMGMGALEIKVKVVTTKTSIAGLGP